MLSAIMFGPRIYLMEKLYHYVWKHKLLPLHGLCTMEGDFVEVVHPGFYNTNSGPDFFNSKVRIGEVEWAGNIEIHVKSSDWYLHGHHKDETYDSVVLHVVGEVDREVYTGSGRKLPQVVLPIPNNVMRNYESLLQNEKLPPCHEVVSNASEIKKHLFMSNLTAERLESKAAHIKKLLCETRGDWEHTCFIVLARAFGFGINADTFELWAKTIHFTDIGKHRDNLLQVEAFFFGQAGFFEQGSVAEKKKDEYYERLAKEYMFLQLKFSLEPINFRMWRYLRLRPQNFPQIRLAQFAALYFSQRVDLSKILKIRTFEDAKNIFQCAASDYWDSHYTFGCPIKTIKRKKQLPDASIRLLIINAVVPMLYTYGVERHHPQLCECVIELLNSLPPEHNKIVRRWRSVGLIVRNAGESQAVLQLERYYCQRHDCLRCRFGTEYLKTKKIFTI